MHTIDFNTSFGRRVVDAPHCSLPALGEDLDRHGIACALTHSHQGIDYDPRAGNAETIAAARADRRFIPVATLDPRDSLGWRAEVERCVAAGVRAFRFFPGEQGWSVDSVLLRQMLQALAKVEVCAVFSAAKLDWSAYGAIARMTQGLGLPVVLTDVSYGAMSEAIAVMQAFPHVHVETNWLATVGAVEIMVDEVGAGRLLYGSAAPDFPMQKALNQVLEADIADTDKAAILGGNAARLLGIAPDRLAGRPTLDAFEPKCFAEPIVDIHSHLGHWRYPIRDEGYDPAHMLRRMRRFGITHSILSSYESMRYDIAAGNRAVAAAIAGRAELLGYVEINPYQIELSCKEMDRYFRLPNFAGCELELSHIPSPTGGGAVAKLIAEVAKRGKPILLKPAGNSAAAERELALRHPNLTIVHAHGFAPDWARIVADAPNICVEFNYSHPSHHNLRAAIDILGAERVLFGTDQTLLSVGAAVGLYWDAQMSPEERRLVLHENARRIYRLAEA